MEGAQQIEQDPCLPLFAHCISVNAAWAPADPCGDASSLLLCLHHFHHFLTSVP